MSKKATTKNLKEFKLNFIAGVDADTNLQIMALKRILFTEEGVQRTDVEFNGEIVEPSVKYELENKLAFLTTKRNELIKAKMN